MIAPAPIREFGRRHHARREIAILVIAQLLRADRGQAGNQHQFVGGRQLHHLARRQQRAGGLLTGHHDMAEPWREAETGRASWRERGGQYVYISVVAVSLKKKKKYKYRINQ